MDSNSREAQDWLRRHLDMLKDGGAVVYPPILRTGDHQQSSQNVHYAWR